MITLVLVSLAVIVASAAASAAEAALFSVSYSKARAMAAAKKPGAKALLKIKDEMPRAIGTVVIINNLSNIVGSGLVGVIAHDLFGSVALGVFFGLFTLVIILFAELVPKTLGEAHADRLARFVAPAMLVMMGLFRPVLWLVTLLVRPFRADAKAKMRVSEEEIKIMARMGHETGDIETDESRLIQRVFKLNDITAEDMMTPLSAVESLPGDVMLSDLRGDILNVRHSRLPVYGESPEIVLGVVMLRDLLSAMARDKFESTPAEYAQEPLLVANDMPADDLLPLFQQKEQHLAIVVDGAKKMVGVVSLEDVLEELVGEITDEKDLRPETIKRLSKSEIMVGEGTPISKINHFFNVSIAYDGSIGDMVVEKLGRRPKEGDELAEEGLAYRVAAMSRTRPKLISIRKNV